MKANKIAKYIVSKDAEGVNFAIDLTDKNIVCAGVKVLEIGMYVSTQQEDSDYWGDGDMYVSWDMQGLQNNEDARTAGTLLLRNVHSDDDVTAVMGEFYWEGAFTEELQSILADAGFSAKACADVSTSEWGMQDEGRASYDAYAIADEVRSALGITTTA